MEIIKLIKFVYSPRIIMSPSMDSLGILQFMRYRWVILIPSPVNHSLMASVMFLV